ncbi:MAG: hypothetical protein WC644_00010 [Ignavibacteria bacterium]
MIQGGDYIMIDGIDIIPNSSLLDYGYLINNATETDGANNNTIKNSVVGDTGIYKFSVGILQSTNIYDGYGITPSSNSGTNSNNKYYNITVQKAGYGIWLYGDITYKDSNCEIGSTSESIGTRIGAPVLGAISSSDNLNDVYGINLKYQNDFKIFNTEIRNCLGDRDNDEVYGINVSLCGGNSSIFNCMVHDIKTMSPHYSIPVFGIYVVAWDTAAVININNNIIYAINHWNIQNPSYTNCVYGIYTEHIDVNAYNNSARIDEDSKVSSTVFYYNSSGPGYSTNIMNNAFANYSSGNSGSSRYCIFLGGSPPIQLNHNTYYTVSETNNYIGYAALQNCSTLSNWQKVTGKEKNSYFGDPGFISASNLLPDTTSVNSWNLYGKGYPLSFITNDIRGLPRSTTVAGGSICIGAYEFTSTVAPPVASASGSPVPGDTTFYAQSERNILNILWGESVKENKKPIKKEIENKQKKENKLHSGALSWKTVMNPESLPANVNVQKYSGSELHEVDTTSWINPAKYGTGYWKVTVDAQPSLPFAVTLYFGDEELGSITDPENNLIMTKYDPNNHTWTPYSRGTGEYQSNVNWANRTVTVTGLTDFGGSSFYSEFALTDQTAPLKKMRLDVKALIAGFYNDVSNTMVSDLITLELRTEASPYTLIDQTVISASTTGGAEFYSYSAYPGQFTGTSIKYWIVFKHRNSLETWSAVGNSFSQVSGMLSYDFTTAITQAYGSNLILKGTKYCIINGDADQDGSVGALDRSACWNNRNLSGYYSTDLDGDGSVGALDRSICWNNRNRTAQKPASDNMNMKKGNEEIQREKNKGFDLKLDGSNSKRNKINKQ